MQLAADEQRRRGDLLAELHAGPEPFVIPNPWDAGTARLLSQLGFHALATTSAGLAYTLGLRDGTNLIDRDATLSHVRSIVAATDLPVSADLESGFGETPDDVAATIRLAAEAGLVGGSIEDATGRPEQPIRPLGEAVQRVAAAVEAAKALPFRFTLTARAENFLYGHADLDDTIRRLRAFAEAGADVLYAPALPDLDAIRAVCSAVERPVNVLANPAYSVAELRACGVRRISLGSGLVRTALGSLMRAGREIQDQGTFSFAADALPYDEANALMSD